MAKFASNQFVFRAKKRGRRLISVVEIDHKTGLVYYTSECERQVRQPFTPSGISMETFNSFFGVNARDYAPA